MSRRWRLSSHHYGTAIYGNIGAADRLDLTVTAGQSGQTWRDRQKSLDLPLVVSDNFADVYGGGLMSVGRATNCAVSSKSMNFSRRRSFNE